MAKYVTFSDLSLIYSNVSASKTRLSKALQGLIARNWLTGSESDQVETEEFS